MVKFDKIATIDKSIIAGRLGPADPEWLIRSQGTFLEYSASVANRREG